MAHVAIPAPRSPANAISKAPNELELAQWHYILVSSHSMALHVQRLFFIDVAFHQNVPFIGITFVPLNGITFCFSMWYHHVFLFVESMWDIVGILYPYIYIDTPTYLLIIYVEQHQCHMPLFSMIASFGPKVLCQQPSTIPIPWLLPKC